MKYIVIFCFPYSLPNSFMDFGGLRENLQFATNRALSNEYIKNLNS